MRNMVEFTEKLRSALVKAHSTIKAQNTIIQNQTTMLALYAKNDTAK